MRRLLVLPFAVLAVAIYAACGTDASGIDACRKIETARCQAAPACKLSLASPPHVADDIDGCIDFYRDACLHGLEVADPGGPAVDACVAAIAAAPGPPPNSCFTVAHPETNAACSWLVSASATADASTDVVDASDGSADADDGSTDAASD